MPQKKKTKPKKRRKKGTSKEVAGFIWMCVKLML